VLLIPLLVFAVIFGLGIWIANSLVVASNQSTRDQATTK
jgi:hypothetical protein